MTPSSPEDENLVHFLRQHHPLVPPAAPGLEQQVLQQVRTLTYIPQQRKKWRFWVVPSMVVAGFLTSLAGYLIITPHSPSTVELANLEDFIDVSWQGAMSDDFSTEPWYVLENITDN